MDINNSLTNEMIAERLGWHKWDMQDDYDGHTPMFAMFPELGGEVAYYGESQEPEAYYDFLNDISAAWLLVQWANNELGYTLRLHQFKSMAWSAKFVDDETFNEWEAWHQSEAGAIASAFMQAAKQEAGP